MGENKYLFVVQVKWVVLSGLFWVDTNKLACQTCLLRVMQVNPLMICFLSSCFQVDPFMIQTQ